MTHVGKEPSYAKYIQIEDSIPVNDDNKDKISDLDRKLNIPAEADETAIMVNLPDKGNKEGKKPSKRKTREEKIKELKEKLKNAIDIEDYGAAAHLRDEIKALEVKNEKKKK